MALCAKCGQEVGGFAGLLSHTCVPRKSLDLDERKRRDSLLRLQESQQGQMERRLDDLDREIELANNRDFGEGKEQEDRFGDSARVEKRWNSETKQWDRYTLDRTGSALRAEAEAGGTPSFDPDEDLPKDPHDRAEFRAREMRFPREQVHTNGDFRGGNLTEARMNEAERAEFTHTGKVPASALQRMSPAEKLEHFKSLQKEAEHPKQEVLDLELGLG